MKRVCLYYDYEQGVIVKSRLTAISRTTHTASFQALVYVSRKTLYDGDCSSRTFQKEIPILEDKFLAFFNFTKDNESLFLLL